MLRKKILSFLGSDKVELVAQIVLGGVFVYAGLGKALHPDEFMVSIENYRLLPGFLVRVTAYILPWMEIVFGSMLILNIFKRFSGAVLSILLVIFIFAIISALLRGISIDCGCFMQSVNNKGFSIFDGLLLLFRDMIFLLLGFFIIFFKKQPVSKE